MTPLRSVAEEIVASFVERQVLIYGEIAFDPTVLGHIESILQRVHDEVVAVMEAEVSSLSRLAENRADQYDVLKSERDRLHEQNAKYKGALKEISAALSVGTGDAYADLRTTVEIAAEALGPGEEN